LLSGQRIYFPAILLFVIRLFVAAPVISGRREACCALPFSISRQRISAATWRSKSKKKNTVRASANNIQHVRRRQLSGS
jgi:hypothetical protein